MKPGSPYSIAIGSLCAMDDADCHPND